MISRNEVANALARHDRVQFRYGESDCCMFVADVLFDLTGVDYAARWRGTYSNEFGARRIIDKYDGLADLISAILGEIHAPWAARPGSPVLLNRQMVDPDIVGEAVGIFDGDQIRFLSDDGLQSAPISAAIGAWNV